MKLVEPYSFLSLVEVHGQLEEVFLSHQEALTLLELDAARELLAIHGELLAVHMRHEEELVLPVFERVGPIAKWPAVLYTGQHRKMLGLLESVPLRLEQLVREPRERRRRAMLRILDHETTYKHLVEHHEGAELEGLFPNADRGAEPDERRRLLQTIRDEWDAAFQARRPRLEELTARWGSP